MAAREMSRLNVSLTASIGNWEKNLEKAANKLVSFVGISKKTTDMLIGTIPKLTALFGGVGIAAGIKMAATRMDELAKASERLGLSSKELAGLQHAAAMGGSSAEGMTQALEKLTAQSEAALSGNKKLEDTFRSVGVSMDDLRKKNVSDVMSQIADSMQKLSGPGERMATTLELFGKGQHAMATVLADGSAGLKAMAYEADALGLSVSRLDGKKIQAMNDAVENIANVSNGIFNQLAAKVAPIVTDIANGFTQWTLRMGGAKAVAESLVSTVFVVAGKLGDYGQKILALFEIAKLGVLRISELGVAAAGGIILGISKIYDVIDSFVTKIKQAFNVMSSIASVVWEGFKVEIIGIGDAFKNMWNGIQISFASGLESMSRGMRRIKGMSETADSMVDVAAKIRSEVNAGERESALALRKRNDAIDEAKKKAIEAADAFSRPVTPASETNIYGEWIKSIEKVGEKIATLRDDQIGSVQAVRREMANSSPSEMLAKYKEFLDNKRKLDEENDAAIAAKEAEQAAIKRKKLEDDERAAEAARIARAQHNSSLAGILEQEELRRKEESNFAYTRSYLNSLNMQTAALAKHSKAMFAVNKGVSMANAVMNTAEGVTKAWSYGPILGPVLAGLVAAAGAAQIAVIAGTSYGQQSGSVASTGGAGAGDAAAAQASSNVGAPRQQAQDIIIYGDTISTDQLLRMTEQARERGVTLGGFRRG
jgi:hypothetical protein